MLDISPRQLDKVLYFANYIVTDPGFTPLGEKQLLTEREYKEMREKYEDTFEAGMGAEAIQKLLAEIDLDKLSKELREELEHANGQKRVRLLKRLECVESFLESNQRPEWMIMTVIPVIPPDLPPAAAGRRPFCDLRPERSVPPRHQPQQPPEAPAGTRCA